eukprot:6214293-Pleurochrysis_carterae.AAC.1
MSSCMTLRGLLLADSLTGLLSEFYRVEHEFYRVKVLPSSRCKNTFSRTLAAPPPYQRPTKHALRLTNTLEHGRGQLLTNRVRRCNYQQAKYQGRKGIPNTYSRTHG